MESIGSVAWLSPGAPPVGRGGNRGCRNRATATHIQLSILPGEKGMDRLMPSSAAAKRVSFVICCVSLPA